MMGMVCTLVRSGIQREAATNQYAGGRRQGVEYGLFYLRGIIIRRKKFPADHYINLLLSGFLYELNVCLSGQVQCGHNHCGGNKQSFHNSRFVSMKLYNKMLAGSSGRKLFVPTGKRPG